MMWKLGATLWVFPGLPEPSSDGPVDGSGNRSVAFDFTWDRGLWREQEQKRPLLYLQKGELHIRRKQLQHGPSE